VVLSGVITAVSQAFQTLILVLLEISKMGREAVKELLDFQRSQPIAFGLVIGTMLIVFIATPLLFDFSWNSVLFGNTDYDRTEISSSIFLTELTAAERDAAMASIDLVMLSGNATTDTLLLPNKPISVFFGKAGVAGLDDIIVNSWTEGSYSFRNYQESRCGELATQDSNTSIWEVMLMPEEPVWTTLLALSIENTELREQNVWFSCYESETDASTEIALPGTTLKEKANNLTAFIQNGSVCEDAPLNKMALEAMDPFRSGGTIGTENPLYWLLSRGQASWVMAYEGIKELLFSENLSSFTPTAPIDCYLMVNRTSRQRFYKGVPTWLADTGDDASLFTSLFYYYQVLDKPSVPLEKWKSLEAIEVKTPVSFQPGVASVMLMPYEEVKRTTNTLTLDQTRKYWEMFEDVIIGVIMIIVGLSGVGLVLNAKNITLR